MAVGESVTRAIVVTAALVACGTCGADEGTWSGAPLEAAIARELGIRFSGPVRVRCFRHGPACTAVVPGGVELPVMLERRAGEWRWRVLGMVITTNELEAYLRAEVRELGSPQDVRCTPRIRRVDPGERITCELERGGKAFVIVRGDGTTSVEVVLDPAAAAARAQELTPAEDAALSSTSRELESSEELGDEEATPPGVPADVADLR